MNPGDFRLLAYFVDVVRAGSIRGGARKLRLSPAVVSAALKDLEAAVGATLLTRTTRSMALTEAGTQIYEQAVDALASVEAAMVSRSGDLRPVGGRLAVTLPVELAVTQLPGWLRTFEARYPDVKLQVHAEDQALNLSQSEFDLAVRAEFHERPRRGPDICANVKLELVCAPERLADLGEGLEERLEHVSFIATAGQARNGHLRVIEKSTGEKQVVPIQPKFTANNHYVGQEFARRGFGCALLMSPSVKDDLEHGRLVRLSEAHDFGVAAVPYPDARQVSVTGGPGVQAPSAGWCRLNLCRLGDHLVDHCAQCLFVAAAICFDGIEAGDLAVGAGAALDDFAGMVDLFDAAEKLRVRLR